MTKIIAFCGRSQSGKNTSANFIFGLKLVQLGVVDGFRINDNGQLVVPARMQDGTIQNAIFNPQSKDIKVIQFLLDIWPAIKLYSFADPLKEFCIAVFGLTTDQCYGSNDQKNTATQILFKDLVNKRGKNLQENEFATARQVLQLFGTDICRRIKSDCWTQATMTQIQQEGSDLAIITDARFKNEIDSVKNAGGKAIKLLRNPLDQTHSSEVELDQIDDALFDLVVDNSNMTIAEQNKAVATKLKEWQYIDFIEETQPPTI